MSFKQAHTSAFCAALLLSLCSTTPAVAKKHHIAKKNAVAVDTSGNAHHEYPVFRHFGKPVTISMTMTIPQLSGTVPTGASIDVTPYAIAPNGKLFKGEMTNIVPANALITPLNNVVIPKPLRGNYVIGYFMTLGEGSPLFPPTTLANFSGLVVNNQVGNETETITIPVQTLFLATTGAATDVMTVSANFPIV